MDANTPLSPSAVYAALMRIPQGRVATYGDIAKAIGHPKACRAVGRILNGNPNPVTVPCHRVVMSNGTIGGYAFGKSKKRELLQREGVLFDGESVVEFKKCRVEASRLI